MTDKYQAIDPAAVSITFHAGDPGEPPDLGPVDRVIDGAALTKTSHGSDPSRDWSTDQEQTSDA